MTFARFSCEHAPMHPRNDLRARCQWHVRHLNAREQWNLTEADIAEYAEQIAQHLSTTSTDSQIETVARYFHQEHKLVTSLSNSQHLQHHTAWEWASQEITRALHVQGLAWSKDRSIEIDDLVQTVRVEIVRSLGHFRYSSSLRTWLQSITLRRIRRYHRDSAAAKRPQNVAGLEQALEVGIGWEDFEDGVRGRLLLEMIRTVLAQADDKRLAQILLLRAVDDKSAEDIGRQFELHPSRVRTLLSIARDLLKNDLSLQQWLHQEDDK